MSLWNHSLLPLLLVLFDIWILLEQYEDVEVFITDAMLLTFACSWFCTRLLEFFLIFLCKNSFSSSLNARLSPSILKQNIRNIQKQPPGDVLFKKVFFCATSPWYRHWLTCFAQKGYSHRRLFFPRVILP